MKNKGCMNFLLLLLSFSTLVAMGQSPATDKALAFPGAEGFGRYTTGGRGGKVYTVTNLNDKGPGSLREAVNAKGPRTVVFAVSGTIALESPLSIKNGDITIAGQTAPGDGICIRNYSSRVGASNVIVRYLRFRLGDAAKFEDDAFNGTKHCSNIIIDHCSMSWSIDETASFYYNKNFTMQWCIAAESLEHSFHSKGPHGYGGIWGGEGATFHHNLLASHTSRNPRFSGSSTTMNPVDELVDFSNNVIFNWGMNATYGGEQGKYNVINNYYKPGPATVKNRDRIINPWEKLGKFYVAGNYHTENKAITANNWLGVQGEKGVSVAMAKTDQPFDVVAINLQSAQQAYKDVLLKVGANLKRDAADTRILKDVATGSATEGKAHNGIIDSQADVGGWPELKSLPAPIDQDHDGMPDSWEKKHGLNSTDPNDGPNYKLNSQYTNLEVYLNEIVKNKV